MSIQKIARKSNPFLVRYRGADGKRASAVFATRSEAEAFERAQKKERAMPAELQVSAADRADFARLKSFCDGANISLAEALAFLRSNYAAHAPTIALKDAVSRYLDECERRALRPRTVEFYSAHIDAFCEWAAAAGIADAGAVSAEHAKQFLSAAKCPAQAKSALRAFWAFLVRAKFADQNVFAAAKIAAKMRDRENVAVLSVEAMRANLAALRPEFRPLYALMAFAGIRPEELLATPAPARKKEYLQAADIDFERRRITIRAAVAKTRVGRVIYGLPDNIWSWLEPIKKWRAIVPAKLKMLRAVGSRTTTTNAFDQWRTAKRALPHKIPHDALRHTFCSCAYHVLGVEHAVEVAGHDYNVFKRRYKGLIDKDEALKYFSILPA
ncbi:MAG: site-specific integrase [Opitutales bacterium]|nr:site-specific integrase [Opitutales bacterium]